LSANQWLNVLARACIGQRTRPRLATLCCRSQIWPWTGRYSPVPANLGATIIAKLEWAGSGESDRQLRDVASILAAMGDSLDRAYLERWIESLGLQEPWARALMLTEESR
jgi:hypothetical protein